MKLRQARKDAGKTQQQVAAGVPMGLSGYRKIEDGHVQRPTPSTIYGISWVLGVDPRHVDEFRDALREYERAGASGVAGGGDRGPSRAVSMGGETTEGWRRGAEGLAEALGIELSDPEDVRGRYAEGESEDEFRRDPLLFAAIIRIIEQQQEISTRLGDLERNIRVHRGE